ncbi:dynactin subunit 2 [Halomonas llamarensis]|uniref:Dynactin subunit 2 n=1 Tax=Halomonas llamarensis TaxID=2945104 RepID=A0ABT0SRU6_9GAMM|nr:dynactin subunit 2 [Halomonas llamarensis]MCL7930442.1 dynactin subunit 2 [Halomonas llamarensis]
MATRLPNYQMRDGRTRLGQSYFNPIWADLDSRLDTLEKIRIDWQNQVAQLRDLGLQRIDEYIRPVVDEVDALLAQATEETNGLAASLVEQHLTPVIEQVNGILSQAQNDTDGLAQTLVDEHIAPILAQAQQVLNDIQSIRQQANANASATLTEIGQQLESAQEDAAAITQLLANMGWEQQLEDLTNSVNNALTEKADKSELDSKADSNHKHDASDITSGVFSEDRIPAASSSVKGGVRVWKNGTTGYIYTSN